ncbi:MULTISPECIES: DUF3352 domain-containing protein [unclassified Nocardioides]|uniref:DUF3352 domain-containing protein n=1 Tax=unclassified Nocardioides TaxID=2615069 RepID=UPI0009F092E0|nr:MULTISPECIES: DUF3352 domain-containing protein [unclassified Nocardioides]GAW51424.1 uncharacterized protein PD653B2_3766 [Nocardioides sp. PD653-B2]GAW54143.1 uncharacterized protein PD653_1551 [Nocardioides sp. PD653]
MSSNVPPGGPGVPEYLDSHGGGPRQPPPPPAGGGRRTGLVAGGVISGVVLIGAGAWGAWSFFATGPQPAEALPDSTVAYVSVDLDPSGGQKIEALRTLREFPAFKDKVGLDTDDDIRERIFEEIQKSSPCDDLDYGDDIEPWLGDRMALAAVDTGGDTPTPVFVLQVSDDDAADAGLQKLEDCGGDGGDSVAWAINDGWALLGESQDTVDGIAKDAAESPLSGDDDYTTWTDETGDPGIMTAYVAPEAGQILADNLDGLLSPFGGLGADAPVTGYADALEDFQGMAATVRFDDGALEVEVAADAGSSQDALSESDRGDDVLATLPDDTAAAIGVGLADGWFGDLVDQLASSVGGDTSADELLDQLSQESGLDLPDDAETLAGDSAALAVGADFDPNSFLESGDGTGVPVGLKVQGDPDEIEKVLDKLRLQVSEGEGFFLDSDSDGDMIAIGPDEDYRQQLLDDGDLGDSDVFQNVVREAGDAAAVLFVNFDAGDDWLSSIGDQDPEIADNLEPLQGLGLSTWLDDDTSHLVLRVTTD